MSEIGIFRQLSISPPFTCYCHPDMPSKDNTVLLWFTVSFLFIGVVWTALLTVFNLWVSTGPPTAHPEVYRTRGEIFLAISIVLLVAFVVALRGLIRNQKRIDSR
jgi:heme/copper-type cytochrome/quinol oxidase subunit 2